MKRPVAVAVLVLSVFASYATASRNGFVWDDTALVLRDPLIRSWRLIPEGFNHYLFVDATASDFYRPLQRLTYTIEYGLFALRPGPFHLTNILLHAAAAVALFFLAEAILSAFALESHKRRWIALIAAFVWAIHPVQSAAINYVSGRADPLAALFGFSGCYFALRGLGLPSRRNLGFVIGAGIAFLLSALSKESGLLFPLLAMVLLALLKKPRSMVHMAVVSLFVTAIYLSLRLAAEHEPAPILKPPPPFAALPITIARAVAEYTGLVLLPLNLHMDRDVQGSPAPGSSVSVAAWRELQTLTGVCLIAAAAVVTYRTRRSLPSVFALLVLTAVSYLPVSGIVSLNASVAEHWIYVPSAFLFLALAVASSKILESGSARRSFVQFGRVAFVCWLGFLGTRTFLRTFDWRDQRTFLERTIASGGNSARMLINLGGLELSEDRLVPAKEHLQAALKKDPEQPFGIINLAAVSLKENDFATARDLLGRATQMPLVEAQAHELLAVLENKEKGRADLLRLRLAAHTGAPTWSIEKRYIKLLAETGATAAAVHELQSCLRTEWYRAESWQLLAQLLMKSGHAKEAAEALACANSFDVHLAARPRPL